MAAKHRSHQRPAVSLGRRPGTLQQYDRVLIVCEGSKTEPGYFEEVRQRVRLPTADVRVLSSNSKTAPIQVVDFAIGEFAKTRAFERVYAVFDRDDHASYANAIHKAQSVRLTNDERRPIHFDAVVSVPCFELWFLLHFAQLTGSHHRDGIVERLLQFLPEYTKGLAGMFDRTSSHLPAATDRAKALRSHAARLPGTENYTDIDRLVSLLLSMRGRRA